MKCVGWCPAIGYPRSFTPGALVERYSLRQHYLYILARSIPFAYEMAGAIDRAPPSHLQRPGSSFRSLAV